MRRSQWWTSIPSFAGIVVTLVVVASAAPAAQTTPVSSFPTDAEIRRILADRVDTYRQTLGIIVGTSDDAGHRVIAYGGRTKGDARPIDADGVLAVLRVEGLPVVRQWCIVHRRDKLLPPAGEVFKTFMLAEGAALMKRIV